MGGPFQLPPFKRLLVDHCSVPPLSTTMFPIAVIVLSAIIAHVIFSRVEPRGAAVIGILILGIPAMLSIALRASFVSLFSSVAFTFPNYLLALLTSVCIYRLSPFHPLARFPGPVLFRLSRIPAWIIARSGGQHRYYLALHQRYGPCVRTGTVHGCAESSVG